MNENLKMMKPSGVHKGQSFATKGPLYSAYRLLKSLKKSKILKYEFKALKGY